MLNAAGTPWMPRGGGFLLDATAPGQVFTPEDFSEEHRAIARTTDEFWRNEVEPHLEAIQRQEPGAAVSVLRKSAELGLTAVLVPDRYGGMELDLASAMIVAERVARDGSYAAWHGAHSGIGTIPILLFGTEEQKQTYLPRLVSGELVGAYCLSESHAGSDALAARTRATLNAEGTHYLLNGQKMRITNGGAAGLFTVFAKIDGEQFTAFLVERGYPGLSTGAEEKKMGIKGSSTTAVYFDNVPVPVSNVLGEIGRGHVVAFNILNLGRLKLGPFAVGGAKQTLGDSLRYAKERHAFGKAIGEFGLIQHKLAEMAIRLFAAEAISYRVTGDVQLRLAGFSWDKPGAAATMMKALEEFAAECSFVKVFASEMLDYVVDEGVQIHGGYGYHQDYAVERAYRDSRINRIFEGTNEINRLLAAGILLKRSRRGQLELVEAVKKLESEIGAGKIPGEPDPVARSKKIFLLCLGVAYRRFKDTLDQEQEVLAGLSGLAMGAYAMESVTLRAARMKSAGEMARVFVQDGMAQMENTARGILAACLEGEPLRATAGVLHRFAEVELVNTIELRRRIASRLLDAGKYVVD